MAAVSPVKSADQISVNIGQVVTFTVTLTNSETNAFTNVSFQDTVQNGFTFVTDSVTIDGVIYSGYSPNNGFSVPDVLGGTEVTITYQAIATYVPSVNPVPNIATMVYDYTPDGGSPGTVSMNSNQIFVYIGTLTLNVTKTPACSYAVAGGLVYYEITVANQTAFYATAITLYDNFPVQFDQSSIEYSTDGGTTWQAWTGQLDLGDIAPNGETKVILRARVSAPFGGIVTNIASVNVTFCNAN